MSGLASALRLPHGTVVHDHQVAGHVFEDGKRTFGMLKDGRDGSILKAASKPVCGRREIEFYRRVNGCADGAKNGAENGRAGADEEEHIVQLRQLIPEFRGTVQIEMDNETIDFIRLGDITSGMTEPCVMDIKIGKRTWDPLATIDKIQAEEEKYAACKKTFGLCIPGFQVYNVKTGTCKRFGKEYGKNLNETSIRSALQLFLNAEHGLCRALLVQILSGLWSIQKWARSQRSLRLYSSSVLIAYDARLLRNNLDVQRKAQSVAASSNTPFASSSPGTPPGSQHQQQPQSPAIQLQHQQQQPSPKSGSKLLLPLLRSAGSSPKSDRSPFDWSPTRTPKSPATPSPATTPSSNGGDHQHRHSASPVGSGGSPTTPVELYRKVQRTHSVRNNYDEDLKAIRENYAFMLDNLIGGFKSTEWVHVKMIDFAHVFDAEPVKSTTSEKQQTDGNYLFGIESAVRLFEDFLRDCQ